MSPKSLTPWVDGITHCKDADIPWVERVSFLIVHNYNAEPFKALIGKYCIHLELQRKYIGKQSVITQSGIGPRLEIHTPANSPRRFLMTIDDQASVFLVWFKRQHLQQNQPSSVTGRDQLHSAAVPLSWQNWQQCLSPTGGFPLLGSAEFSTNKMRFCLSRDKCKPTYYSH